MSIVLEFRREPSFNKFVEEGWFEVLKLRLKHEHLLEELGDSVAVSLVWQLSRIGDPYVVFVLEELAKLCNTDEHLHDSIHVAEVPWVIKTDNSPS